MKNLKTIKLSEADIPDQSWSKVIVGGKLTEETTDKMFDVGEVLLILEKFK